MAVARSVAFVGLLLLVLKSHSIAPMPDAIEASGIVRVGTELLIVSDSDAGGYYRFPLSGTTGSVIRIDPHRLTWTSWSSAALALDLESIGVLADGRVVLLSERLRALIAEDGIVMEYDDPVTEVGEHGLEGLAIRPLTDGSGGSRVAVLWEGGYPSAMDLSVQLLPLLAKEDLRPVVVVHDVAKRATGQRHRMDRAKPGEVIELQTPIPSGGNPPDDRFRAPDLVWHSSVTGEWHFIVLLSSYSPARNEYKHLWLQRFGIDGKPIGEHADIDTLVPAHLRGMNWEGLGWFEPGQSLVLVDDRGGIRRSGPPTAVVVPVPQSWRSRSPIGNGGDAVNRKWVNPWFADVEVMFICWTRVQPLPPITVTARLHQNRQAYWG
jgi:hypothetical protein